MEDIFSPDSSPEMREELLTLNGKITDMPVYFKADIVISYLKNHSIKNEWIKAHPELVTFLLQDGFVSKHIEALFDFCRLKPGYRDSFESYIKKTLLN
jgi:hypothetical protein